MKSLLNVLVAMGLLLAGASFASAAPAKDLTACRAQPAADKISCFEQALEHLVKTSGTEEALNALESLAKDDADALRESHPLVHHIGKRSFAHYGAAPAALSHCTAQFWSGCYHGVLQAYLSSLPQVEPQHILSLCPVTPAVPAYSFQRYNCLHGVGHGLTMQFRYDVLKSLAFCDALPGPWERESCYGGVFMENIVAFQEARRSPHAHHHEGHAPAPFLNANDPLYPCSVLNDKYLPACYLMQTSAILTFTNFDFAQAFPQCERVPDAYRVTCARSLGRDISGFTLRQADRVKELCGRGRGDQVQECLVGAAKDFMLTDASPDPGLALCRTVDVSQKRACYATVGEIVLSLLPDRPNREAACRRSEDAYIEACLAVVRVY